MTSPKSSALRSEPWLCIVETGQRVVSTEAGANAGRWMAPGDSAAVVLAGDEEAARAQVAEALNGTSIDFADLRGDAPLALVTVAVPSKQRVAEATTDSGLVGLGLPASYPNKARGGSVANTDRRKAVKAARAANLRGIVIGLVNGGTEFVWLPAKGAQATISGRAKPFARWSR